MKKVYFDYGSGWEDVSKFIRDDLTITDRFANSNYHYAQNVANMTMLIGDVPEVPDGSTPYYYMEGWEEATASGWIQTLAEDTLPTTRGGVYQRDFITISGGMDYVLKLKCTATGSSSIALVGEKSDDTFEIISTAYLSAGESVTTFTFTAPDTYTGIGFVWDARVNIEWSWLYIGDGVWVSNLDKLKAATEVKVLIQDIDGETTTQLFQGLIAEKPSYEYDGIFENIQIDLEATDRIRKLDVETGDFVMRNAKIMDFTDKDNSIIHQLAYAAGLTDDYIADVQILITLSGFAPSSEKSNILTEIDKLCYENGYVLRMDEYDKIHPLPWIITSGVSSHTFSETNVIQSIAVSESEREFEGVKVTYNELGEKDNVLLYRDDLPYNSDGTFTGYSIPAGYYYPIEANVIDETTGTNQIVYQEYEDSSIKAMTNKAIVEKLDFDARTAMGAFKSDYSAIVATSGHYLEYRIDGGLTPDTAVYSNKKAQIRFNNTTASGVNIYYLNVKGSCLYRTADRYSEVITVSGSKKIDEYTSSYIFDKTIADTLAQYIAMEQDYGRFTYKFKSDDDVAVGSLVSIVNDARMNQDVLILERTYSNKEDLYEYTCKGYSKTVGSVTGRRITRTPIKDSFDVVSLGLSSYALNILSDINGENLQLDDATITCTALVNGMDYTTDWTFSEATTSGVLGSISGNVYTISGMTSDSGYVDILFHKEHYTDKTLRCTVSRIRQGVTDYVIETIPDYAPKNLGRYEATHPATHNPGDYWTVYDTDDDPIERGIWYDNAGTPTRISSVSGETGYTTDATLLAKLASCMADVAWCEKNSYGVAADYGIAMFFESFGAVTAFIQNLFAQNITLGESGYLKSHDYAESGGSPTAGFMLDVANQIIKAYGANFVNTYIKNAQIIDAVISGILSTSEIETKKAVVVTWTAPANYYLASELITAFGLTIGQTLVASGTFNGKTVTSISCTAEGGRSGPTVYVYFSDDTYLSGLAFTLTQVTYPGSITVNQSAIVKSLVDLHSVGIITTEKSFNSYNITTTSLGSRSSGSLNANARSAVFTVYKPISVIFISGNINSFKLELAISGSYFTVLTGNTANPTAGFLNPGQYVFHNISESDSQNVTLLCVGAYGTTDGSSIWS